MVSNDVFCRNGRHGNFGAAYMYSNISLLFPSLVVFLVMFFACDCFRYYVLVHDLHGCLFSNVQQQKNINTKKIAY